MGGRGLEPPPLRKEADIVDVARASDQLDRLIEKRAAELAAAAQEEGEEEGGR